METTQTLQNEAIGQEFMAGLRSGYSDQMNADERAYEKYEAAAKASLEKAKELSHLVEKKLGISPALAISLVAAGLSGGAGALPAAAIMYYAKKYYLKGLGKAVDYTVDKAAGLMNPNPTPGFKEWLAIDEGIGDWAARGVGYGLGRAAGLASGVAKGIYGVVAHRLKEFANYVHENPKQAAKVAMTIALAAATGGVVGKISKELIDNLGGAVQNLVPDKTEVAAVQQALSPQGTESVVSAGAGAKAAWHAYEKQGKLRA